MSSTVKINEPLLYMQRLLDSQSLLSHLVEQTSDMLTATDVHFRHVSWNKAAESIFGITAEEIIGKDIRGFMDIEYNNRLSKHDIRDILLTKGSWKGEASFTRPTDGYRVTIIVTIKQLVDENNTTVGYLLSGTDITERKITEQVIRESENRFREMADSAPVMIWMSDVNNKTTYVNRTWLRSTGVDLVKLQSVGWVDLVHPDDVIMAKRKFDKHFNLELPVVITYRLKQYDDTYRWVQETGIPRKLADGTFVGFIGSVVDIHDQKLKEEQLGYQATILDNVSDIIITYDMDNHIETWNRAAEDYYSISATDAIGKKLNQLISIKYINSSEEQEMHELKRTGFWKGEKSFLNSKSETCYFLDTCKYIYQGTDKKVSLLSVSRDITDRKKAEESILQSEKFYRTLIADSSNGTILSNSDGIITYTSHAIKPVLGYEEEEILGRNLFEFVHPDDFKWAMESFQKEIEETPDVKSIVIRLLQKSGNWLWCMIRGHNLLDNPYVKSFVVYFHDDTHRKNANDALKESEKRFRSLIRDLQIGVLLQDSEGKIVLCNSALCNLFLLKEEDIIGKSIYDVAGDGITEDGRKYSIEERPSAKAIQTGKPIKDFVIGIYRPQKKDRVWVLINSDPILDENGNVQHIVSSVKDITERKRMEEELLAKQISHQKQITQATIDGQENERTEIGKELHDNIGQQLTTIKLFLDMARTTSDDSTIEMVNMALKGISDVINEVRNMSRSLVPSTLKDLGLVESIEELVDSFQRTQRLIITFQPISFDEELIPENQKLTMFRIVQEQLTNIIKYAEAKHVKILLYTDGPDNILEIKDDGIGFEVKKIRKGLGFTNIKNRAEVFGGHATIFSKPGKGCSVKITFPVAAKA